MPITYQIDADKRTIRTKCLGNVTLPEVIDHFRTLEQDPKCPERLDVFLDLREMNSIPEPRQISTVITELRRVRARVRFDACAILACGDALFGMMRMFEALAEELFRVTRAFRAATEAEAWLALVSERSEDSPTSSKSMIRESRRSTRVSLRVMIEVLEVAPNLTCEGETIRVNLHGALISTAVRLSLDTKIQIHVFLTDKRAAANVVYVNPENHWQCGIALAKPQNIWGISLPPDDWHEGDF